ncbi:MAG: hypothetical protein SV760_02895 [Halobacteria archaeon]|nr:hypothetical protein [Halobacteria archaeon]
MGNDVIGHGMGLDYAKYAKRTFILGVALMVLGWIGEEVGRVFLGGLPGWEETLLLYSIAIGLLLLIFSIVGFGIFLPLTE